MIFNKSLVFNLIGDINSVYKASVEIHNIVLGRNFGSKIVENKYLINELDRDVKRDVFIYKSNYLRFNEIKKFNESIYKYQTKNIYFYNLFIVENNIIDFSKKNEYNINNKYYIKKEQIKKILYLDYSTF